MDRSDERMLPDPIGTAARGRGEEFDVPAELRRTNAGASQATGCMLAAIFILFPALVYFGLFGLLLLDDLILETHFVSESLPQEALDWLVIIYWPLIALMRWALGLP